MHLQSTLVVMHSTVLHNQTLTQTEKQKKRKHSYAKTTIDQTHGYMTRLPHLRISPQILQLNIPHLRLQPYLYVLSVKHGQIKCGINGPC